MPRLCRMERSGPTIGRLILDLCKDTSVKASIPTVGFLCLHPIDCRVITMYNMLFYWRKQLMGAFATRCCGFQVCLEGASGIASRALSSALSAGKDEILRPPRMSPRPTIAATCVHLRDPVRREARGSDRGPAGGRCSKDPLVWKVPRIVSNRVGLVYKQPKSRFWRPVTAQVVRPY